MADAVAADLKRAEFHARWRWAGAPLLINGVALLGWSIVGLSSGGAGLDVMLGCFSIGMGLASFGANHDTAMAFAGRVRAAQGALTDALRGELDEELERDRAGTLALRPAPRIGLLLPIFAMSVQAYLAWRLLG